MTQKPQTYISDLHSLPKALLPLTKLKRWVIWRWEIRKTKDGERWTKPPYQCQYYNEPARSNDPNTWDTYEAAVAAFAAGRADGIGFMLRDGEFAAVDLDHVRDIITGEIIEWARRLCVEADQLELYREITVSNTGLRFIGAIQRHPTYFVSTPNGHLTPHDFSTRKEAEQALEASVASGQWKHELLSVHASNELDRKFKFDRESGAGIELYRNCARFITISGLQEGSRETIGEIDYYLDELYARYDAPAELDFNTAGVQSDRFKDLIENGAPEGERSERFQEVVWHLASIGQTVEEIVEELAKHPNGIGQKYTNRAGRLLKEVTRSFGKWQNCRRAGAIGSAAASASANTPWPQIKVKPGELPRVVNEAETALLQLGHHVYQRGGLLMRPILNKALKASCGRETEAWQLIPITVTHLVETLCRAAQFLRYDGRAKAFVPIDAPDKVAEVYLNRQGSWKMPPLAGMMNTPFLRGDGSICETPGYDRESQLLYKADNVLFPPISLYPDKNEALAALERLQELISTFPFVSEADRAVALGAMLTVLDRRSIGTAPLFAFTSPSAGTGKSLLVDLINTLATGKPMPVLSQGSNEEEFEKRFGASLIAGNIGISIDNCEEPLSGALLCQALTQDELDIRLLGHSRNVRVVMNATIFATGNNLEIAGDLTRRCLLCSLDAGVERPELREFDFDALERTRDDRGDLVHAALTMLRAWHVAREEGERVKVDSFGGFADWSRRVREALVWLGVADPCATVAGVRENDPQRDALSRVMAQWKENLQLEMKYTLQEVINKAMTAVDFHSALMGVASARGGGMVSNVALGHWLRQVEGKIVDKQSLVRDGIRNGYALWKLKQRV